MGRTNTSIILILTTLLTISQLAHASKTADDEFNSNFYDCERFAAQFPNTCPPNKDVNFQYNFDDVPLENKICYNIEEEKCAGVNINNACWLKRQLCVRCFIDQAGTEQKVRIRVQTNTIPNHCYQLEQHRYIEVRKVDYTVDWLPKSFPQVTVDTQRKVNKLLCDQNAASDTNIPEASNYVNNGQVLNNVWGVSTSGAIFSTAIAEDGVDPFYPAPYGQDVKSYHLQKQNVDWCLASTNANRMFQYKVPSICLADPETYEVKDLPQKGLVTDLIKDVWKEVPFRTTIGISKDGRPIMSPYKNGGQLYEPCDVDVCNGVKVGDHYMYVATTFHPYIMGCYGEGNSPNIYQECSENPRLCGVKYEGVKSVVKSTRSTRKARTSGSVMTKSISFTTWMVVVGTVLLHVHTTLF